MKIGIIGCGFVGSAIYQAYKEANIECIVQDPGKGFTATKEQLLECDGIFICVPSPSLLNGACDTSILESVVKDFKDYNGVLISKVTAPPNVYTKLKYITSRLVYVPEFLTAVNAVEDYKKSEFLVIGGNFNIANVAADIIKPSIPIVQEIVYTRIEEASLMKYTINSFLASKVIFMNELFLLCEKANINFEVLSKLITLDTRIGSSHTQVPGPDGYMGFGGMCFPKDVSALIHYARELNCNLEVLNTANLTNNKIRQINEKT